MTNESKGVVTRSRNLAASCPANNQHEESMNLSGKDEESITTPATGNTSSNDIGTNGTAAPHNVEPTVDMKQMLETLMVQNRMYGAVEYATDKVDR